MRFTFTLPKELKRILKRYAKEMGMSQAMVLRLLIMRLKEVNPPEHTQLGLRDEHR